MRCGQNQCRGLRGAGRRFKIGSRGMHSEGGNVEGLEEGRGAWEELGGGLKLVGPWEGWGRRHGWHGGTLRGRGGIRLDVLNCGGNGFRGGG